MPRFNGAVGAPKVGHHQWQPRSRRPLVIGSGRYNRMARLMLHEMRWREPPRELGLRITAVVMTVLVHLGMLFMLAMRQPPGRIPSAGQEQVASVEVRLIEQPEPKPKPPPPPPIVLPERPVPPTVKRAPVAAMPAVPVQAPQSPQIELTPDKPEVALTLAAPSVPHVTASPATREDMPAIVTPPPPKVVEELSSRALPPPPLQSIQVAPVKVPSPALQPVPTTHQAPVVTLGKPDLEVHVSPSLPTRTRVPAKVVATMPSVPSVQVTQPTVQVTPSATLTIAVETQTHQALQAPEATLAPITPNAAAVTMPRLNLPVADVLVPQAPQVQAPTVQVRAPEVAATPVPQPSAAASSAVSAPSSDTTDSWVTASDQFKPASGQPGDSLGAQSRQGEGQGVVQLLPRGNSDVMTRNSDRLGYKSTVFDQYWAPDNESILDTFLRHFIEKLTVKHTFHVAPGVRVHCVLGPMALFFGCGGDPPRPMSSKSGDPRLNMAPARSLVPTGGTSIPTGASTAPTVDIGNNKVECAVARVAGSPPPPGCPGAPPPPSESDVWH